MSLFSLKQLLLRKTEDESLRTIIQVIADDVLANQVIESLRKMAENKASGGAANAAIKHFANEIKNDTKDPATTGRLPDMMREALSHHASRYKAALASGNKKLANEHAGNFFKILRFGVQAEPHTGGALQIDRVDIKPWERGHPRNLETFAQRIARDPAYAEKVNTWHLPGGKGKGKMHQGLLTPNAYINDTKGAFRFEPAGNDWSFLQNDPHESEMAEVSTHGHVGAYPMEHVAINGKHISIDPVENLFDGNKSHPFDHHPIMKLSDLKQSEIPDGGDRAMQYMIDHEDYYDTPHFAAHTAHQNSLRESGKHESRGLQVGEPVHPTSKKVDPWYESKGGKKSSGKSSNPMREAQKMLQQGSATPQPAMPSAAPTAPAKTEEYKRSPDMQALWDLLPGKKP